MPTGSAAGRAPGRSQHWGRPGDLGDDQDAVEVIRGDNRRFGVVGVADPDGPEAGCEDIAGAGPDKDALGARQGVWDAVDRGRRRRLQAEDQYKVGPAGDRDAVASEGDWADELSGQSVETPVAQGR